MAQAGSGALRQAPGDLPAPGLTYPYARLPRPAGRGRPGRRRPRAPGASALDVALQHPVLEALLLVDRLRDVVE